MARTLREIIEACLPEIPASRYSDSYWIAKANFVLDELSTKLQGPYREMEVLVPLVEGVTRYRIPSELRRPSRIRYPNGHMGVNLEDPATGVSFSIVGDHFRLSYAPTMDSNKSLSTSQLIMNGSDRQYTEISNVTEMLDWPDVSNWGAIITHYSAPNVVQSKEYSFVSAKRIEPFDISLILNGPLTLPAKEGDDVEVISNFLIVSGPRSLTHFATMESPCPLPTEFDRVLGKGLLMYLRLAMDDDGTGPSVAAADELFRRDVEELTADNSYHGGDQYPARPRSPAMYGGLRRRS